MDYQMAIALINVRLKRYQGENNKEAMKVLKVLLQDFAEWENLSQLMLKDKARYIYGDRHAGHH